MTSQPKKSQPVPSEAVVAAPAQAHSSRTSMVAAAADDDSVRVMDLRSLSAADSSASLNVRRRSHTRNSTASYVSAWQSQQVLDHLSKKIISSMGSSAASSPRETRSRAVSGVSASLVTGLDAELRRPQDDDDDEEDDGAARATHSLRDVYSGVASTDAIPGFIGISRMALKLAGTAQKDAVTRTAMSAFQRWRRLPLLRGTQPSLVPQPSTIRESTVSSLFNSAAARNTVNAVNAASTASTATTPAPPRLPMWVDPSAGITIGPDTSPLATGFDQRPPAKVGRRPSTDASAPGTGAVSAGASRRVTPRGAVLLNSYSDNSEALDERAASSSLAALTHNVSGDPSLPDRGATSGQADSGVVSPTQPIISLIGVHSRRTTPSRPLHSPPQTSRSCSARSGPSLAVGDEIVDDFQRRWEEEGLSMSDRLEDLMSIEEDHRYSTVEKEQRRRARLLARYTRASDAIFMGALKVSTGSRVHPSLASSAANPSLDVQDTPSDDNLSFWAAVSVGVGYNHPPGNTSGSSFLCNGSGSEATLSARSAGRGGVAAATAAGGVEAGAAGHGLAVPQVVSQRGPPAPLPLAPTPRQSTAATSHVSVLHANSPTRAATTAPRSSSAAVPASTTPEAAVPRVRSAPSVSIAAAAAAGNARPASASTSTSDKVSSTGAAGRRPSAHVVEGRVAGSSPSGPLEDSLASEPAPRTPHPSSAEALPAAGSEDGLEDVTLSAATISCNNSLNSTRNNLASTSAGAVDIAAHSHPMHNDGPAPVRKAPPTSATTPPTLSATRRAIPAPPAAAAALAQSAIPATHTDEEESTSSNTPGTAVTTKQPPRSLPSTSSTTRRVRPLVDKPQSDARHELEQALKRGGEGGAEEPTKEAERAVLRGAQAIQAQQRRDLGQGLVVAPMKIEDCTTAATAASATVGITPTSTSVVARRRRDSGLTLARPEPDNATHAADHRASLSLFPTPAASRRVSLGANSPSAGAAAVAAAEAASATMLMRDTYHDQIRAPEKEARHAIIIDYRSGLLDILKECHFLNN